MLFRGGVLWLAKRPFHSRRIQALPQLILISRPSPDDNDGNIRFLGCFNGLGESRLVIAPSLASLSIVNFGVGSDRRLDAIKWSDPPVLALGNDVVSVLKQGMRLDIIYQKKIHRGLDLRS